MKIAHKAALALIGLATPALAQDFSPITAISNGMLTSVPNTAAMNDVILHNQGVRGYKAPSPRGAYGGGMAMRGPVGGGAVALPPPVAISRLQYQATPATEKRALEAYVARTRRSNPRDADAVYREMSRHDLGDVYRRIAGPFGLRDGNAADTFTALTVLGWMITNGAGDPSPQMVQAARAQFAGALASDPTIGRNPTAAGEEYKLSFLILYSSWKSAQRDGGMQPFAAGVARLFGQRGLDLRGIELGPDGFRPRQG